MSFPSFPKKKVCHLFSGRPTRGQQDDEDERAPLRPLRSGPAVFLGIRGGALVAFFGAKVMIIYDLHMSQLILIMITLYDLI